VTAFNQNNARTGWNAGGGGECLFMPNWSAKLESLYVDLASGCATGTVGWNYGYHRHHTRTGLKDDSHNVDYGTKIPIISNS
jgi:outer membrane immunogenic protein